MTSYNFEMTLQEAHEAVLFDQTRFRVLNAGRGFGKTQLFLADMLEKAFIKYTDQHGKPLKPKLLYMAPQLNQAKAIMWDRAQEFFKPIIKKVNQQELKITLLNGAEIKLCGSNHPDSARGSYCTFFYPDETAFFIDPDTVFNKIIRPMLARVMPHGGMLAASTPDGKNFFWDLCKRGMDNVPEWAYHHYITTDGGFVDASEVEAARRDLTFEGWRQEFFAEFINPTSLVYYKFDRAKHTRQVPYVRELEIHWAWDFNIAPACHSTLSHIHKDFIYVFDEICEGNTPANVDEFCTRYPPERVSTIKFYGDYNGTYATSGLSDFTQMIDMLHRRGYNVSAQDLCVYGGNPIVRARTENFNRLLEDGNRKKHMVIDKDKCKKLIKDLELLKRKPDGSIDKTSDPTLSHISDAASYMTFVTHPPKMPDTRKPKSEMERAWKVT